MIIRSIIISGKVQGVFFRASAKEQAENLGITGWVKNLPDGTVEIHAQGEKEAMQTFLEWCKKGPESAFVEQVQVKKVSPIKTAEFEILR